MEGGGREPTRAPRLPAQMDAAQPAHRDQSADQGEAGTFPNQQGPRRRSHCSAGDDRGTTTGGDVGHVEVSAR